MRTRPHEQSAVSGGRNRQSTDSTRERLKSWPSAGRMTATAVLRAAAALVAKTRWSRIAHPGRLHTTR